MQFSGMRKLQSKGKITCTELSAEHNPCLHTFDVTLITNRVSRADWNMDSVENTFTEFYDASEAWFGATEMFQVGSEHSGHSQEHTCRVCGNIYFIWNIQALQKGWFVIFIDWGTQLTPFYCHLQLRSCFCRYQSRAQNASTSKRLETSTGWYKLPEQRLKGMPFSPPAATPRLTIEKSQEHLPRVPGFTQTSYRDSLNLYTTSSNAIDATYIEDNFSSKTSSLLSPTQLHTP